MPDKEEGAMQRREQILQAAFKVALRERLARLTMRQVAGEADLSISQVSRYFHSRDTLLVALLDWLLDDLFATWQVSAALPPHERLLELVEQEMRDATITQNQKSLARLELLYDYWTLGSRVPAIRQRMLTGLERWRQMFLPIACDLIEAEPTRFPGVTPQTLVTLILSLSHGYTLQTLLGHPPTTLDQFLTAVRALLSPSSSSQ
ncbi:TetR/AcrR family transcriptional regulator [Dictyobacter aurantiacus]|uniref:HTH tetR-type domain-containing protein n=1 Tax=Dictyobacter aurantiacus TaxID=1936993 RepID=A0A401ZL85_9CHLR|nr:TetR/AcrR family transcriptional regulator [Dictyobacter aurantiacus]GCE07606.1 hypothetical protein KDAU_49350 [Dictyobacter aurantiacus]